MQIEGAVHKGDLNSTGVAGERGITICYETAPLYAVESNSDFGTGALDAVSKQSTVTTTPAGAAAPPTISSDDPASAVEQQSSSSSFTTDQEKFQAEITKWEEYYDQIRHHLSNKTSLKDKHFPKSASNFSIGQDGNLFYAKTLKDGSILYLKVIRSYSDRVRICREIHLDTDDVTLHHRRDKMLEVLGQMYFWKGQRRDVCQCIASCAVCSAGLGAKRKAKPPGQKRDIPRNGPPDPPKKKIKTGRPRKPKEKGEISQNSIIDSEALLVGNELSVASAIMPADQITEVINQQQQHQDSKSLPETLVPAGERDSLSNMDVSFHQIFTIEEHESSPVVQQVSASRSVNVETQDAPNEEVSIYELLFKLPSIPSSTSPSVVEAVHMAMKQIPDESLLSEAAEAIMRQIFSLGQGYNVIITPTSAASYIIAVFASMLRADPLSVSSQISSNISCPMAVLHDSCCAQTANPDLGPIKTCTALTGSYNWNLGDVTYPMDKDMVRMAVQSNRVAAVFYQPYAYIEKSQHISLESISAICHSRGSDVAVIVDASAMPTTHLNLRKLVAEVKGFLEQGADLVLMPSVDKLHGHAHSSVLVGVSSLLCKVWRSIALLQKQVCLPLLCLPHDIVGTVVAYKALHE